MITKNLRRINLIDIESFEKKQRNEKPKNILHVIQVGAHKSGAMNFDILTDIL